MNEYKFVPLGENVEEMFIGPFGSSLKNECFVDEDEAYCMVYEQKHAIQKTMDVETRYVNEQKYNELKRFNIHGGDIIVSCRGTIGETFVVPEDAPLGIMHPSIMKIRLKDGVYDKYYFNLLLKSRLKKHEAEANGSGIKMAISATELGRELFPVPTMQEQQEITDIISGISDVIEKRKQELSALDDLIKARFVEMFGDENNSKKWEVVDVEDVAEVQVGVVIKPSQYYTDESNGVRAFRSLNVGAGFIKDTDWVYFTQEGHYKNSKSILRENDLLIVRSGAPGTACVVTKKYAGYNAIDIIIAHPDCKRVNPYYLCTFTNMPHGKKQIDEGTGGAAQQHFNVGKYSKLKLMLPPKELQDDFADFIEQVDKSKVAVQKALDETQLLFDSLMQQYFG